MARKQIMPEDVKIEDIDKVIESSLYGVDETGGKAFFKLMTFVLLFIFYIFISITIENFIKRIIFIIFGLALLVFLFQGTVLPAMSGKKKEEAF